MAVAAAATAATREAAVAVPLARPARAGSWPSDSRSRSAVDEAYTDGVGIRLRVPEVDDPVFVADVSHGSPAELVLTGSADGAAAPGFAKLLAALHDELVAKQTREIVVDMLSVDAMNAGCFKELVAWVERLQELAPRDRYKIRLKHNPHILWQKHGLQALTCFDTELVLLET